MTTTTEQDFANAKFARNPDGGIAARFVERDNRSWLTGDGTWLSDEDMAAGGWVPVREAADQPITLDALRDAWENAEQADECRPGDVVIRPGARGRYAVIPVEHGTRLIGMTRILHRAPKPTPGMAERLEGAVEEWCHLTQSEEPPPLTDWLAARGIIVTEGEK